VCVIKAEAATVMSASVIEVRAQLSLDTDNMYNQYQALVQTWREKLMDAGRHLVGKTMKDAEILDGIRRLSVYLKDHTYQLKY
jgi:hypothetical protein